MKAKRTIIPSVVLLATCLLASCNEANRPSHERIEDNRSLTDEQFTVNSLAATDAFGRSFSSVSMANPEKETGMFYSLWHGSHESGIYDVTELKETNPTALWDVTSGTGLPTASPLGQYHYFGRPLYGYYDSRDPWVLARHCELFTMAGIDYLVFDTTNSVIYTDVVSALIEVWRKFAAQGFEVPKLAFYTNSHSQITVNSLYGIWFQDDSYDDVWYMVDGKPMLVTRKEDFTDLERLALYEERFTLKSSQWPDERMQRDAFPWMNWDWPQFNHNGTMSVSIAQMPGYNAANQEESNYGRGYTRATEGYEWGEQNLDEYEKGLNFEEEWRTVFDEELNEGKEVNNVFITQWNEWMAIKNRANNGDMQMVDGFDLIYSRDAEMTDSETGYGDGFYLQIARNLRNFAYEDGEHYLLDHQSISIGTDDPKWNEVEYTYRDFEGDAQFRNFENAATAGSPGYEVYSDLTARNDIVNTKIAHDNDNIYVRVETSADIIASSGDESWMNLFIGNPDLEERSAYADNFDFRIVPNGSGTLDVLTYDAETNEWVKKESAGAYVYAGDVIEYRIPRGSLGLAGGDPHLLLKVTDHLVDPTDVDDFYVSGDSAPIGRLAYEYAH